MGAQINAGMKQRQILKINCFNQEQCDRMLFTVILTLF